MFRISFHTHIVCDMHTCVKKFFARNLDSVEYNVAAMKKDAALSFRVPRRLKSEIQRVALMEGRSLAQICQALLCGGLEVYKTEGPKFLVRLVSQQSRKESTE